MDVQLLGKLARAEKDIVSAMVVGGKDLEVYESTWTSLLDEISQASALGNISSATLAIADDVVARVSTLVDCCLSLYSVPSLSSSIHAHSPSPSHITPSFISEAYAWLLENIANPYPSSEFKASLAQRHGSLVSAVSSWFANARRRVGWTALCRNFFRNCRADAVDAAYNVLVKEDPSCQLGSEIIHAFVAMKVAAEELHASSTKNGLTIDIDSIVECISPEDKISARLGERDDSGRMVYLQLTEERPRKQSMHTLDTTSQETLTTRNHFSPSPSRSVSPITGFDGSLTGEKGKSPPSSLGSRKRHLALSEPIDIVGSRVPTRSTKRLRFSSPPLNACPPLSSTSAEDSLGNDFGDQTSYPVRGTHNSACMTDSRKQHLPSPYLTETHKGQRDPEVGLRPRTFSSTPLLSTVESEQSIDEWFKANFDTLFTLPPPVNVGEPDLSIQWEVESFNNYTLLENLHEAATSSIQDYRTSLSTGLSALDDLLQSLESDRLVAPSGMMHPPITSHIPNPTSRGLASLPDLIDWTALNDLPESTSNSMLSRSYATSALPEVDYSILQLQQSRTTVVS